MMGQAMKERLKEINEKLIPAAKKVVSQKSREINELDEEAKSIERALKAGKKDAPVVSDHALVRYLERHHNIDMDIFRAEILTPGNIAAINTGANKIKVGQLAFVIKDRTVVTIVPR